MLVKFLILSLYSGDLVIHKGDTFSASELCCIQKVPFPQEVAGFQFSEWTSSYRIHSSSAEKVSKIGNFCIKKKVPTFVPTLITEGERPYSPGYVWKGVKSPLTVSLHCRTAIDVSTVFFCKANYLVP